MFGASGAEFVWACKSHQAICWSVKVPFTLARQISTSFLTTIAGVRDATGVIAIRNIHCVRLRDLYLFARSAESLGSNLAENGIGSLPEFRAFLKPVRARYRQRIPRFQQPN